MLAQRSQNSKFLLLMLYFWPEINKSMIAMTVLLHTWWQGPGTGEQPLGADSCSYCHQGVGCQVSKPREHLVVYCTTSSFNGHNVHTWEHAVWDLLCGHLNTALATFTCHLWVEACSWCVDYPVVLFICGLSNVLEWRKVGSDGVDSNEVWTEAIVHESNAM